MKRKGFIKSLTIIGLTSAISFAPTIVVDAKDSCIAYAEGSGIYKLLSRLNLNTAGLRNIKTSKDKPVQASRKLLDYYHSRHLVKFFIGSKPDHKVPDIATKQDMERANDALKHVFVGQPDYPPHFVGQDINWDTNPYPDKEWLWQLNRMYFWNALGKVYWATNNEKYARAWSSQLLDWVKKNPHDGHHQYAWRSIEAGIRGRQWIYLFQRFIDAPSFVPNVLVTFLNSVYDHATYLMSKYTKGSNWGLIESRGLISIAIFFPEFDDAKKWQNKAIKRLNQAIHDQVHADGFQQELSMNYQLVAIRSFFTSFKLAKINGLQLKFGPSYRIRIEKMCAAVMKLRLPNGTTPMFGDSFRGEPGQYRKKFKEWAKFLGRKDFLYVGTDGKKGVSPSATAYALKESGYYSMRGSWNKNAICLVLKCGHDGGFHCQPDNGTFVMYAGGHNLMPDSGSYNYGSEEPEARAWFRQTKVHQTLTLNSKNSDYAPKLLLWQPGKDLDKLVVENQSYTNLKHRRAVLFVEKKFFVIVDEAIGKAVGNVDLHFQLAPGKAIYDTKTMFVRSDLAKGWNVFVKTVNQPGLILEKEKGQVSFVYNKKESRPAFRYRINKKNGHGLRFVTVVVPYEGSVPEVRAQIIGKPEIGTSNIDLKVFAEKWGIKKQISYQF